MELFSILINEICTWATARLNDGRWSSIKHGLAIEKEVEDFKTRIASARALFLDLSCIEVSKGIDAILDEIEMVRRHQEDQLQGIHDRLDAQEQARARGKYLEKMLQTVSNPTYDRQGKEPCDAGTRVEVLAEIKKWKNDRSKNSQGFLWLTGEPGAGKSAITATIARDCKDDGTLWAQFFINRNNAETTDPKLYFPSIARQFIDHSSRPDVEIAIVAALKSRPSLFDNISIEQVSQLFLVALKIACDSDRETPVVVVVDGLDETDQSKLADTAQILSQIFNSLSSRNAKILISSRTDDEIRRPFAKMMDPRHVKHMHLDTNAPSSIRDVSAYIVKRISQIVDENDLNWNAWPGEIRMKALCHRASGLFIWAVTVAKFFQDQIRILGKECLDDLLDAVSVKGMGNINTLYWTILQLAYKSCDDDWRFETFRRIVGCVAALKEPLTIAAIAELLDLRRDPSSNPVDLVAFFRQTRTVLVAGAHAIDDQTVPRLHRSFFEFITSGRAEQKFRVDLRFSNGELALQSIRQFTKISHPQATSRTPKLRYAIQFWGLHLSQSRKIPSGVCIVGNIGELQAGQAGCKPKLDTLLRSLTWHPCNPMGLSVSLKKQEVQLVHSEGKLARWCGETKSLQMASASPRSPMVFSPDGCAVALPSEGNIILVWNTGTGHTIGSPCIGHTDKVSALAFSPDGNFVVSADIRGAVRVWDSHTGDLFCNYTPDLEQIPIHQVAMAPDGNRIAYNRYAKIHLLHSSESLCRPIVPDFEFAPTDRGGNEVLSITFSCDGAMILCVDDKGYHLWNSTSGELISELPGKELVALFSPSGDIVVLDSPSVDIAVFDGQYIKFRDARTGAVTKEIKIQFRLYLPTTGAAFSSNGESMILGGGWGVGYLQLCDFEPNAASGKVSRISSTPARAFAFTGGDNQTILIGDRQGLVSRCEIPAIAEYTGYTTSICISTNTILSACFNDNTIYFLDPSTLLRLEQLHLAGDFDVNYFSAIAISPDEKRVAAASTEGAVNLWDVQTRRLVCPMLKDSIQGFHTSLSLSFSSDSQRLTLACMEGTTCVWNASDGSPVGSDLLQLEQDARSDLEVESSSFFDLKNGWSETPIATQQNSTLEWFPSHNPDGGLWAYIEGILIRGNGAGSVTIIEDPVLLS